MKMICCDHCHETYSLGNDHKSAHLLGSVSPLRKRLVSAKALVQAGRDPPCRSCHDFYRKTGKGGRFGKYGEIKRFERLRQKRHAVLPLKPFKRLPGKKSPKT